MGDFPDRWRHVRDLPEGGQGYIYIVRRSVGEDDADYVLKRLKNPKRSEYFEREIKACVALEHPNVLKIIDHGHTPQGRPYLVTEFCPDGSIDKLPPFTDPLAGLLFFEKIVAAVANAHAQTKPIYHLDLKPQNILVRNGSPLVGDFGLCFIDDGELSLTKDGPLGSQSYCAPELRDRDIPRDVQLGAADVYSLGKLLYWLFTGKAYDGHESQYSGRPERHLASLFSSQPEFAFIDDLVRMSVVEQSNRRFTGAPEFLGQVRAVIRRVSAGGRVLDLRTRQRCVFCQEGYYRPAHDFLPIHSDYMAKPNFPEIEKRQMAQRDPELRKKLYSAMREASHAVFRIFAGNPEKDVPMVLVCDYCGNVQYFRLDLIMDDGTASNWKP